MFLDIWSGENKNFGEKAYIHWFVEEGRNLLLVWTQYFFLKPITPGSISVIIDILDMVKADPAKPNLKSYIFAEAYHHKQGWTSLKRLIPRGYR